MRPVVIFDIEATCEDRAISEHYNMETIEIGAVKLIDNKPIDEFQTFIEPEYTSKLTPFCIKLTGITMDDLQGQPKFNKAIIDFYNFIKDCDIYSCGEFDRKFLTRELEDKGTKYEHELIKNAINATHRDMKRNYTRILSKKKTGMIGMAEELNIELTGLLHRGIDDARNLAKIYIEIERLREMSLRKVFNNQLMKEIVKAINTHHKDIYEINKNGDKYICIDKLNGKQSQHGFLEFIDLWVEVIEVDNENRRLDYLNTSQLKTLKHYTY